MTTQKNKNNVKMLPSQNCPVNPLSQAHVALLVSFTYKQLPPFSQVRVEQSVLISGNQKDIQGFRFHHKSGISLHPGV